MNKLVNLSNDKLHFKIREKKTLIERLMLFRPGNNQKKSKEVLKKLHLNLKPKKLESVYNVKVILFIFSSVDMGITNDIKINNANVCFI